MANRRNMRRFRVAAVISRQVAFSLECELRCEVFFNESALREVLFDHLLRFFPGQAFHVRWTQSATDEHRRKCRRGTCPALDPTECSRLSVPRIDQTFDRFLTFLHARHVIQQHQKYSSWNPAAHLGRDVHPAFGTDGTAIGIAHTFAATTM